MKQQIYWRQHNLIDESNMIKRLKEQQKQQKKRTNQNVASCFFPLWKFPEWREIQIHCALIWLKWKVTASHCVCRWWSSDKKKCIISINVELHWNAVSSFGLSIIKMRRVSSIWCNHQLNNLFQFSRARSLAGRCCGVKFIFMKMWLESFWSIKAGCAVCTRRIQILINWSWNGQAHRLHLTNWKCTLNRFGVTWLKCDAKIPTISKAQPSEQHEFVWWTCKKCTSLDGMHSFFPRKFRVSSAADTWAIHNMHIWIVRGKWTRQLRNKKHYTHTQWHLKSCMQHHHIDDWVLWMCQIDIKSHSMTETNELHNQNRRFDLYSLSILLTFSRVCLNRFVFFFQCIHWKWIPNMHCCMLIQIRCEARISEDLVS